MAMRLHEVMAKVAVTTVEWEGEQVDVGYHPAAFTPALTERVQAAAEQRNLDVLGIMLDPLVDWWDVLDEQDQRIPPTPDTIKQMPQGFLNAVMSAIQGAMKVPQGEGETSGAS